MVFPCAFFYVFSCCSRRGQCLQNFVRLALCSVAETDKDFLLNFVSLPCALLMRQLACVRTEIPALACVRTEMPVLACVRTEILALVCVRTEIPVLACVRTEMLILRIPKISFSYDRE